jgi:hypothetical protein
VGAVTRAYRREWIVVILVWASALSFFHEVGPQDITRLALTESIVLDGSLRIDRWQDQTVDKAVYGGHYYSDKAPGMSFLAIPPFVVLRAAGVLREANVTPGIWKDRSDLWTLRALVGGLGFFALVVLVGRVAEGVEPGTGAITATSVGLGTLAAPLAATMFGHLVAAALGFAAFVAAWSGLGATTRRDLHFAAAAVPSALALAAYDDAAFDSPFHLSYRYVASNFASEQAKGFFGIGVPDPGRLWQVLFDLDGLLPRSPILVLSAVGLVLLWRKGIRAEAALCGAVTVAFLALNTGYYDILGGGSPGPRFFVPALPFLGVGLACSFGRWPRLTLAVAVLSVALMTYRSGTWFYPDEGRFLTIWSLLGAPIGAGAAFATLLALCAVLLGAWNLFSPRSVRHTSSASGA